MQRKCITLNAENVTLIREKIWMSFMSITYSVFKVVAFGFVLLFYRKELYS